MTMRHAIYFAPAHSSPWWTFGAGWLGRDESLDGTPPEFVAPMLPAPERHHITTRHTPRSTPHLSTTPNQHMPQPH